MCENVRFLDQTKIVSNYGNSQEKKSDMTWSCNNNNNCILHPSFLVKFHRKRNGFVVSADRDINDFLGFICQWRHTYHFGFKHGYSCIKSTISILSQFYENEWSIDVTDDSAQVPNSTPTAADIRKMCQFKKLCREWKMSVIL